MTTTAASSAVSPARRPRRNIKPSRVAYHAVAITLAVIVLLPVLYALLISFTPADQILEKPANYVPSPPTGEHYDAVNRYTTIGRYMLNSLLIAGVSTLVRLVVSILAAFAFAFLKFPGRNVVFMAFLATMMVPGEVTMLSNYQLVSNLGLVNTYLGMMAVFLVTPLNIFMLRQAFLTFPVSLREAAHLDGAGNLRFLFQIVLPASVPVLVTIAASSFISIWNSYLWPLLVTNQDELRTVQVGITQLSFPEGSAYGPVMAGSIVVLLPSVLVFLLLRRRIIGGMTAGAVR